MDSYRKAMDKVRADDEFRASLLKKLESEQQRIDTAPKKKTTKIYPVAAGVASAAVLLFTLYFSKSFILPLLQHDSYDGAGAEVNSQVVLSPRGDKTEKQEDMAILPETPASDVGSANTAEDTHKNSNVTARPNAPVQAGGSDDASAETGAAPEPIYDELIAPSSAMAYKIVSFPGYGEVQQPATDNTVSYDMVIHFTFVGFEKYDVGLFRNDMLFNATLPNDYTLADFFADYYYAIIAADGMTDIDNGIVESFFGINVGEELQINVYADGVEVLNLETAPMSQFKDMTDVYLTVSVI